MTKFVIALALIIAALTAVPAAAGPTVKKTLKMAELAAPAAAVSGSGRARLRERPAAVGI